MQRPHQPDFGNKITSRARFSSADSLHQILHYITRKITLETDHAKNVGKPFDPSRASSGPSFRGPSPTRVWMNPFTLATGNGFATFSLKPSGSTPWLSTPSANGSGNGSAWGK